MLHVLHKIAMHASSFIRLNVILAVLRAKFAVDPVRVRGVHTDLLGCHNGAVARTPVVSWHVRSHRLRSKITVRAVMT